MSKSEVIQLLQCVFAFSFLIVALPFKLSGNEVIANILLLLAILSYFGIPLTYIIVRKIKSKKRR